MQIEQINALLLEKVNLQGDSIDVREKMLARERDFRYVRNACFYGGSDPDCWFSDLKRVIAGKDLPEDVKSQLVALHEEVGMLKEQYKESQDKLSKAKAVCANLSRASFLSLTAFPVHQISRQVVQRGTREEGRRGQRGTLIPGFVPMCRLICPPQGVHEESEARIKVLEEEGQRLKVRFLSECQPINLR